MQNRTFTDQLGRVISVPYPPLRIISLVPSQTELLFDLGLDREVAGITKFCVHPRERFNSTLKIGGTKKLDLDKIRDIKPDLIIGNKEENDKSQIETLMMEFPVWMSDISGLDDAMQMISLIGSLIDREDKAEEMVCRIRQRFDDLKLNDQLKLKALYFIWKDPYMLAGNKTFINEMLIRGGYINATKSDRYPVMNIDELRESNPDVIFLSSEPYPFKQVHVIEMKKLFPHAKVIIVDGELFSWYGSRLLQTPGYLQMLSDKLRSLS